MNFFDDILRKDKPLSDRTLRYFTWGRTSGSPRPPGPSPGQRCVRFYLTEGGGLSESAPSSDKGEDPYVVDFEAESSPNSRWVSPLGIDAWYENRIVRDQRLLVYETPPLTEDLEVTDTRSSTSR